MKKIFIMALMLVAAFQAIASSNTYSTSTGNLFVKNVTIDGANFHDVALTLRKNGAWSVDSVSQGENWEGADGTIATYTSYNSTVTFPTLDVDGLPQTNIQLVLNADGTWKISLPVTPPPATTTQVTPAKPAYNFSGTWYVLQAPTVLITMTQTDNTLTAYFPSIGQTITGSTGLSPGVTLPITIDVGSISVTGGKLGVVAIILTDTHVQYVQKSCTPQPGYYCKLLNGQVLFDLYKK